MTTDHSKRARWNLRASEKRPEPLQQKSREERVLPTRLLVGEIDGVVVTTQGVAVGGANREQQLDRLREAANMLELQSRQSISPTPMSLSSKEAQTLLRQF